MTLTSHFQGGVRKIQCYSHIPTETVTGCFEFSLVRYVQSEITTDLH